MIRIGTRGGPCMENGGTHGLKSDNSGSDGKIDRSMLFQYV